MKRLLTLVLLVLIFLSFPVADRLCTSGLNSPGSLVPACAQTGVLPALTGRVVDNAGLLSAPEEARLVEELEAFERRSSDQVVVATIESLNGENLEDFANRLFRHWGLGQEGVNNGVLFLVARNDRKIRIEVGYGLEGTLTDALAKTIIDAVIVPRFRAGDFSGGITEGTRMIIDVLSGDTAELEARKQQARKSGKDEFDWVGSVFFIVWSILFFGPIIFAIGAPIFGKKIGKRRYRWLGIETTYGGSSGGRGRSSGGGWSSGGGGFSGGGGSSGGGGASGGW